MKQVEMNKLKRGDIICFELKLRGREAFEVLSINEITNQISVKSRLKSVNTKSTTKPMKGIAYLLRRVE